MATMLEVPVINLARESSTSAKSDITPPTPGSGRKRLLQAVTDARSDVDTEEEVRPRKERRIKGRRRAVNPLPHVEAALRRQQELKTDFRTLARPLKAILREMARRATHDLEHSPTAHQEITEAEVVQEELRERLVGRQSHLQEVKRLHLESLSRTYELEKAIQHNHCRHSIDDIIARSLEALEQDIISLHRNTHFEHDRASQDTESEPIEQAVLTDKAGTRWRYDSFVRHKVEVRPAFIDLDGRASMRKLLQSQGLLEDDDFTTMDVTRRHLAKARKSMAETVDVLLRAGDQVNHDAVQRNIAYLASSRHGPRGLLALADAATTSTSKARHTGRKSKASVPHTQHDAAYFRRPGPHLPVQKASRAQGDSIKAEQGSVSPFQSPDGRPRTRSLPAKPDDQTGQGSVPSHAFTPAYAPAYSFDNRPGERPPESHIFSPPQHTSQAPVASPFYHRSSMVTDSRMGHFPPALPPLRYGTMDYPPMPPTAQPVNHFANAGLYRAMLPPIPPPLIINSPLVALPQPRDRAPAAPFQFFPPPPVSQPPLTMPLLQPLAPGVQPPISLYRGPMLAPAAGPSRTAQPVFAQQMDRQEQNKRRNTEGNFPRFRPYHGPPER